MNIKNYKDEKVSGLLGRILSKKAKKIHGSRNYYQFSKDGILIEVIPVLKINKPEEAEELRVKLAKIEDSEE